VGETKISAAPVGATDGSSVEELVFGVTWDLTAVVETVWDVSCSSTEEMFFDGLGSATEGSVPDEEGVFPTGRSGRWENFAATEEAVLDVFVGVLKLTFDSAIEVPVTAGAAATKLSTTWGLVCGATKGSVLIAFPITCELIVGLAREGPATLAGDSVPTAGTRRSTVWVGASKGMADELFLVEFVELIVGTVRDGTVTAAVEAWEGVSGATEVFVIARIESIREGAIDWSWPDGALLGELTVEFVTKVLLSESTWGVFSATELLTLAAAREPVSSVVWTFVSGCRTLAARVASEPEEDSISGLCLLRKLTKYRVKTDLKSRDATL
jgi:hypothetical protein